MDLKSEIKKLLRRLHDGESPDEVKEEFQDILTQVTPAAISKAEEELVQEGLPREELNRLCEVHLLVFREQFDEEKLLVPSGHPLQILMQEHQILLDSAAQLRQLSQAFAQNPEEVTPTSDEFSKLEDIIHHFQASEKHYLREENVLFPYIEKHGLTEPPAQMWIDHDKIRDIKEALFSAVASFTDDSLVADSFVQQLEKSASALAEMLSNHFYKENNILFPSAFNLIETHEWSLIRQEFDDLGYCCFTPEEATAPFGEKPSQKAPKEEPAKGLINFPTGSLSREVLEAMLNTLPLDITFVDKDDTVRYFSQGKERIFVRTKAVIGRKVQNCHPQKSVHVVQQILDDFRAGERDVAEFWINLKGRLIHIRYFPVLNEAGDYLGCLEVTQDVTPIQQLEGEKRLLD